MDFYVRVQLNNATSRGEYFISQIIAGGFQPQKFNSKNRYVFLQMVFCTVDV